MKSSEIKALSALTTAAAFGISNEKVANMVQAAGKFMAGKNVGDAIRRSHALVGAGAGAAIGTIGGGIHGAMNAPEGQRFSGALGGAGKGLVGGAVVGGVAGRAVGQNRAKATSTGAIQNNPQAKETYQRVQQSRQKLLNVGTAPAPAAPAPAPAAT